jgi:tetratricopeptide (TPR) repeat protein
LGLLYSVLNACSSAPERPLEITVIRDTAALQLELADRTADRGDYEGALELLAEARRLAVSSDQPRLLIRTALSLGNVLFYLNRSSEAETIWQNALAEAESSGEKVLAAVCRIYMARSRLLGAPPGERETRAREVHSAVQAELSAVRSDRLYTALAWTVIGLAEKEYRAYAAAERSLRNALEIHEDQRYLEQAAYDWYLIASVRSVAGNYSQARAALEEALNYDRRAENSYGLGMDWLAIGDVEAKAGESALAERAYRRSAEIFRSIALEAEALRAEARLAP